MILLDVNIFMDVFEGREGIETSLKVMELIEENRLKACISALTVPILWFLMEKRMPESEAKAKVTVAIKGFLVVPLNKTILQEAFKSEMADFEDAIQFYSAIKGKCSALVTRNKKDFTIHNKLDVLTPEEFLHKQNHAF